MIDNIYIFTLASIQEGARVRINIHDKSLTVDGQELICQGKPLYPIGLEKMPASKALCRLEKAYEDYKYSLPGFESAGGKASFQSKCLFKALVADKIPDGYILSGVMRREARLSLELLFLVLIVNGSLSTEEPPFADKWFWQSEKDRDLVILKEWIIIDKNEYHET